MDTITLWNKKEKITVDGRLQHIAFIMDGNGRWAKKRGMPREYGHKIGAKVFKQVIEYCGAIGIHTVTVYAFSTENWSRPQKEVDTILSLLQEYMEDALTNMAKRNIRIVFLGDRAVFDAETKARMDKIERDSVRNPLLLNLALNYGGKDEIVHAVNAAIQEGCTSITEEVISSHLYTKHCTPPDLIVRTGGEIRLSNFLMWQSAYSELYFTDTLWPDFKEAQVDEAVKNFYARQRRYGGV